MKITTWKNGHATTEIFCSGPSGKLDLTFWRVVELPRDSAAAGAPVSGGPCADCRGTGKIVLFTSSEPCRTCDGSGVRPPVYKDDNTAPPPVPAGPCTDCRGTGKIVLSSSSEPCRTCDGSGVRPPVYKYDVTAAPELPAGDQTAASPFVIVRDLGLRAARLQAKKKRNEEKG